MIAIEIDKDQVKRLVEATHKAGKGFKKEIATAINKVSKKTRLDMGKEVREHINIKKAESEKPISVSLSATPENLQAVVRLKKTPRLGLRHFGAKQNKKGVTARIGAKGKSFLNKGAFQGPRPGVMKTSWRGNVFRRVGKSRLPIIQIRGVSAYGAYVKNNLAGPQAEAVSAQLVYEIERRINFNVLRAKGLIKH
jgi:hypothetical protein